MDYCELSQNNVCAIYVMLCMQQERQILYMECMVQTFQNLHQWTQWNFGLMGFWTNGISKQCDYSLGEKKNPFAF